MHDCPNCHMDNHLPVCVDRCSHCGYCEGCSDGPVPCDQVFMPEMCQDQHDPGDEA